MTTSKRLNNAYLAEYVADSVPYLFMIDHPDIGIAFNDDLFTIDMIDLVTREVIIADDIYDADNEATYCAKLEGKLERGLDKLMQMRRGEYVECLEITEPD